MAVGDCGQGVYARGAGPISQVCDELLQAADPRLCRPAGEFSFPPPNNPAGCTRSLSPTRLPLQPPLSIRCVQEDSDEHEYTVGSAIANFFSRGSDIDRLPTSSTCFNLLKLPCYRWGPREVLATWVFVHLLFIFIHVPHRTKRALREKLRYAINAGAGFEMS